MHTWCGVFFHVSMSCLLSHLCLSCLVFSFSLCFLTLKPQRGPSNEVIGIYIYTHIDMQQVPQCRLGGARPSHNGCPTDAAVPRKSTAWPICMARGHTDDPYVNGEFHCFLVCPCAGGVGNLRDKSRRKSKGVSLVAQIAQCNRDVWCDSNRTPPNRQRCERVFMPEENPAKILRCWPAVRKIGVFLRSSDAKCLRFGLPLRFGLRCERPRCQNR